ncbi:MAG TPA: DUF992 domain-containing protein [Rhizobiaceae bacterium]|nr:DUF992 domain-containing protein [Rhizobiaceae bacterium]
MRLPLAITAAFILLGLAGTRDGAAQSTAPVRLGVLTCQVDGGTGKIIASLRELSCIFENVDGRPIERYAGEIRRYGIDIGKTQYSDIGWAVFSLTGSGGRPGALQGKYGGLSAGASIGFGLGANVLVGGLERSFALQPLSLETSRGFNFAFGVASLQLIAVGAFR